MMDTPPYTAHISTAIGCARTIRTICMCFRLTSTHPPCSRASKANTIMTQMGLKFFRRGVTGRGQGYSVRIEPNYS